ncbi:unnamed protein product [Xylocopa violacea]|uniref:Uncharacterized protein n=1 Tax=Xylocopa violacea TaxID=135666 RepID=A0ABP1PFS6_XYLVO
MKNRIRNLGQPKGREKCVLVGGVTFNGGFRCDPSFAVMICFCRKGRTIAEASGRSRNLRHGEEKRTGEEESEKDEKIEGGGGRNRTNVDEAREN